MCPLIGGGAGHRKWSWSDEQLWDRVLALPISGHENWTKYAGNPVLSGTPATWDALSVQRPCVLYFDGKYHMYYLGNASSGLYAYAIGLATSPDGVTWTKYGASAILSPIGAGWESVRLESCAVIRDVYESDSNKRWKMWYSARDGAGLIDIGLATAPNPEGAWTRYAGNPVISDVKEGHGVMRLGNYFFLATPNTSYDLVGYYSNDGITWTSIGNLITRGAGGTWNDAQLRYTSVYWSQGVWYLFFGGYDGAVFRIGMATSGEGFSWTQWLPNPILGVGIGGTWDDTHVFSPSVLQMDDDFLMWYSGDDIATRKIGLATITPVIRR